MANRKQQQGEQHAPHADKQGKQQNGNPHGVNADDPWEPENSRGPRGYGHSQNYGGPLSHPDETQQGSHTWQQYSDRFQRPDTPAASSPTGAGKAGGVGTTPKGK